LRTQEKDEYAEQQIYFENLYCHPSFAIGSCYFYTKMRKKRSARFFLGVVNKSALHYSIRKRPKRGRIGEIYLDVAVKDERLLLL